jgi:hypothetical protein
MSGKTKKPPDINAMALFARVLQHGSLSEASRRLGVPVSTVIPENKRARARSRCAAPRTDHANLKAN